MMLHVIALKRAGAGCADILMLPLRPAYGVSEACPRARGCALAGKSGVTKVAPNRDGLFSKFLNPVGDYVLLLKVRIESFSVAQARHTVLLCTVLGLVVATHNVYVVGKQELVGTQQNKPFQAPGSTMNDVACSKRSTLSQKQAPCHCAVHACVVAGDAACMLH
jgi:hypothetical protein